MNCQKLLVFTIFNLCTALLFAQVNDKEEAEKDSLFLLGNATVPIAENLTPAASDGTYEHYVRLYWEPNESIAKSYYRLYKNTSEKTEGRAEINLTKKKRLAQNFAFDYDVLPGVLYYYWVEAENEMGEKKLRSKFDSGFIPSSSPMASIVPYGESELLTVGSNYSFSWSRIAQATKYQVQIASAEESNWSTQIGFSKTAILVDTILTANSFYWDAKINTDDEFLWSVKAFDEEGNASYFSEAQILSFKQSEILTASNVQDIKLSVNKSNVKFADFVNEEIMVTYDDKALENNQAPELLVFLSEDNKLDRDDLLLKTYSLKGEPLLLQGKELPNMISKNDFLILTTKSQQDVYMTSTTLSINVE